RERAAEEYREALESIGRSAEQMTRTVDALVAAARQEAGLTRTTSDVRDVVSTAVGNARQNDAGVQIEVSLPREPVRVSVDAELAERMLQPLLDNATRYGRSAVSVTVARASSAATIEVDDDGPGVSADERERIFD